MDIVTVTAPVNIAVIKYWGKRDEDLILPLNDSISGTLDTGVMCAKTSVCASSTFEENLMWLNGEQATFSNPRLVNCLNELKKRASDEGTIGADVLSWCVHVCSENNFPTAAGLASSAAGYACLVTAIAKLYRIKSCVSSIARLGSGSACRSVYGGFVRWHAGQLADGSDSIASQIVDVNHWPEMRVLILVVSDNKKKTSSTKGMRHSVATSAFLKHRVAHCAPENLDLMTKAITEKNFQKFAEVTMKDSNQFHAICLDTFPPCMYLNDTSQAIIGAIHEYNESKGSLKVAYTFDAGPNACLYLLESDVPDVLKFIIERFPPDVFLETFMRGHPVDIPNLNIDLNQSGNNSQGLIKYIIHTKIGNGPCVLKDGPHLLNDKGLPSSS